MGGVLPLFGPLNLVPNADDLFARKFLRATFDSTDRMRRLVTNIMGNFTITLVHATNDKEISCWHSQELFKVACDGDTQVVETVKTNQTTKEV